MRQKNLSTERTSMVLTGDKNTRTYTHKTRQHPHRMLSPNNLRHGCRCGIQTRCRILRRKSFLWAQQCSRATGHGILAVPPSSPSWCRFGRSQGSMTRMKDRTAHTTAIQQRHTLRICLPADNRDTKPSKQFVANEDKQGSTWERGSGKRGNVEAGRTRICGSGKDTGQIGRKLLELTYLCGLTMFIGVGSVELHRASVRHGHHY
jgi:hypothetical protein